MPRFPVLTGFLKEQLVDYIRFDFLGTMVFFLAIATSQAGTTIITDVGYFTSQPDMQVTFEQCGNGTFDLLPFLNRAHQRCTV